MVTTITKIKNYSGVSATVKNLRTGLGYAFHSGAVENVKMDIPWEAHFGNSDEYIQVTLDDGRMAFITEKNGEVKIGANQGSMGPAQPASHDGGNRDLVVGKNGLQIHLEGKSPNMVFGGPAQSGDVIGFTSSENDDGLILDGEISIYSNASG